MCRELSALGVKEPQCNLVAFIMKATVCAKVFWGEDKKIVKLVVLTRSD